MSAPDPYTYHARVTEVYDGDSITVDVDLGFKAGMKSLKMRLLRINTKELRNKDAIDKAAAYAARDYLRERILDKDVIIRTEKDRTGKYGRWLAEIWLEDENGAENVNDTLVKLGHAVYYDY